MREGAMREGAGVEPTGNDCRECRAGRPHCHGTLIRHADHHGHCTEPGCEHPEVVLHSLVIDCEAVGCACGQHLSEHRDGQHWDGRRAV